MSYHQNQHSRRGRAPRRPLAGYQTNDGEWQGLVPVGGYQTNDGEWQGLVPVGGIFGDVVTFIGAPFKLIADAVQGKDHYTDWGGTTSDDKCDVYAVAATKDLDAQIERMIRTWRPVDVYSVADMERTVNATMALLTKAVEAIDQAMDPSLTYSETLRMAKTRINQKKIEGHEFLMAIITARAKGAKGIEAKGFKRWVIKAMNTASVGAGHIAYMACIRPAALKFLQGVITALGYAVAAAEAMVKFVIDVGKLILEIPDTALDVMKYVKYGAGAAVAYFLYKKLQKR